MWSSRHMMSNAWQKKSVFKCYKAFEVESYCALWFCAAVCVRMHMVTQI